MLPSPTENLTHAVSERELDPRIGFENYLRQPEFALDCQTTLSGTHYHYVPARVVEQPATDLVLLHALGGNSFNWLPVVDELKDYNLFLIDLPSHGQSRDLKVETNYQAAFQGWLRTTLDDLGIERPHLVGLSTGGRIAADYALSGEPVSSLTMLAPALTPRRGAFYGTVQQLVERSHQRLFSALLYRSLLQLTSRRDEQVRYELRLAAKEVIRDQAPRNYLGVRQTMSWLRELHAYDEVAWAELAGTIACTALFGGKDIACPPSNHTYLSEAGVTVNESPDANHLLPLDDPTAVVEAIRSVTK